MPSSPVPLSSSPGSPIQVYPSNGEVVRPRMTDVSPDSSPIKLIRLENLQNELSDDKEDEIEPTFSASLYECTTIPSPTPPSVPTCDELSEDEIIFTYLFSAKQKCLRHLCKHLHVSPSSSKKQT